MLTRLFGERRGATAVEYGLIAALIALVAIVGMRGLSGSTGSLFDGNSNKINEAINPQPAGGSDDAGDASS